MNPSEQLQKMGINPEYAAPLKPRPNAEGDPELERFCAHANRLLRQIHGEKAVPVRYSGDFAQAGVLIPWEAEASDGVVDAGSIEPPELAEAMHPHIQLAVTNLGNLLRGVLFQLPTRASVTKKI